jgi:hypothetical protein
MTALLIDYAKALALVAPIFGAVALAMQLPPADEAVLWAMRGAFEFAADRRWLTVLLVALATAGLLVAEQRYAKGCGAC